MNVGDRSRVRLLDKLVKQGGWRSLCVVGVKDDLEAKSLGQWCRNLDLTVVWEQRDAKTRHERARQGRACDRMRKWAGIRKGLTVLEMACDDAPAHLAGQQFDCVALWGLSPAQLAADGAKWAALVRDGGALVGTGSRSPDVRGVLHAAVDKWRQLRDGVWRVDVRRTVESGQDPVVDDLNAAIAADVDDAVASEENHTGGADLVIDAAAVLNDAVDGVRRRGSRRTRGGAGGLLAHDPVDSGSGEGETVAVHGVAPAMGAEGAADATIAQPAPKRRGGRPKGSRNKPKVATGA